MMVLMKKVGLQLGHEPRWVDGRAVHVPVTRARFEAVQHENPDKVPTDPIAVFEIETTNTDLFGDLNLNSSMFVLELKTASDSIPVTIPKVSVPPPTPTLPRITPVPDASPSSS
jgi:hypothetical protein